MEEKGDNMSTEDIMLALYLVLFGFVTTVSAMLFVPEVREKITRRWKRDNVTFVGLIAGTVFVGVMLTILVITWR